MKIAILDGYQNVALKLADWSAVTEPIEGIPDTAVDQRNAIGLVASQDTQFTIFAWSSIREMVHAHRLEALLIYRHAHCKSQGRPSCTV